MKKEEYKEYILFDNKCGKKSNEKWLKKNIPDIYQEIVEYTKHLNIMFNSRVYHYINDLKEIPSCLNINCENIVKFSYNNGKGYNKYCCNACANSDSTKKENTKTSNIDIKSKIDFSFPIICQHSSPRCGATGASIQANFCNT